MSRFQVIAFDADDTLWQNEPLYIGVQTSFKTLLAQYHSPEWIEERLNETEMRNLKHFGYGIKAFTLSMIETAIELTEGRITGREIQTIIDSARAMLTAEVELFEHVSETLAILGESYTLMLITKGDLRDQELKIERSGLAHLFRYIEIVSDKSSESYQALLARYNIEPARFLMVGNSLRSDILPVLALGAAAVYIPYSLTWSHESADVPPPEQTNFYQIEKFSLLPALLEEIDI